jgi:hypothetical protein
MELKNKRSFIVHTMFVLVACWMITMGASLGLHAYGVTEQPADNNVYLSILMLFSYLATAVLVVVGMAAVIYNLWVYPLALAAVSFLVWTFTPSLLTEWQRSDALGYGYAAMIVVLFIVFRAMKLSERVGSRRKGAVTSH